VIFKKADKILGVAQMFFSSAKTIYYFIKTPIQLNLLGFGNNSIKHISMRLSIYGMQKSDKFLVVAQMFFFIR